MKNIRIKNIILVLFEALIIFTVSFLLIGFVNRDVQVLGLHMDDLNNYMTYLEFPSLKSWIIDYDPLRMHYRPVFYTLLFGIFKIISSDISRVVIINFVVNASIAMTIYFLMRSLKIHRVISMFAIVMYAFSNFSYYQIYQMIGLIEALPLVMSLAILVTCVRSSEMTKEKFLFYTKINLIIYFLMVFVHERYFPMLLLIIFSIAFNKNISKEVKIKYFIICFLELLFFFAVRYYHLRIIVPRGTDCTSLIDNFDLKRSIKFFYHQTMYLLGVNLGPRYLCGLNFESVETFNDKALIIFSASSIVIFFILYFIKRIVSRNTYKLSFKHIDFYFILYIFLCILQSSLTIRVEMRWLYASFMGLLIYMGLILKEFLINKTGVVKIFKYVLCLVFLTFIASRFMVNKLYKDNDIYIFIVNEQRAMNSLVKNTVDKYGIEELRKKTIYITSNNYNIISNYERYHFFDPFDKQITDKEMIIFTDGITDEIIRNKDNNIIVLDEGGIMEYVESEKLKSIS